MSALPAYRLLGARPRARFRPLLVLTASAVCLPALVLAGPGGRPDGPALIAVAVLSAAAVVGRLVGAHGSARRREVVGVAIILATAAGLLFSAVRSELDGSTWLALLAAASVSMSTIRRTATRLATQGLAVVGATAVVVADRPFDGTVGTLVRTLGPAVLLVAIAGLASALASDLEAARRRELTTRRAAERRAELLEAVRLLSTSPDVDPVDATVDALARLGFPVAAVLLVEGERLVPRRVAGAAPRPDYGGGISGEALATGATIVSTDYRREPLALPGLELGAAVAVPIDADGRTLGVLAVGLHDPGDIPAEDVEVVEVLAAHLGGALATERVVANQEALLARLRELDGLRAAFVDRVSEDLRDPLTAVRDVGRTLAAHGDRLPGDQRRALLDRMTVQADDLGQTIEALLDFSRVHIAGVQPRPEPIDLLLLLAPALAGTGTDVHLEGRPVVRVDREFVQQAIELLRRATLDVDAGLRVGVDGDVVTVDVRLRDLAALQGDFARTLAEQLLLAGGARSERLPDGLRLLLPRVEEVTV